MAANILKSQNIMKKSTYIKIKEVANESSGRKSKNLRESSRRINEIKEISINGVTIQVW